jgi:hypothetical protein
MKIEITAGGIYGAKGEIPIGTELTVKEAPVGWAGRYRVIGKTEGKTPVTNDDPKVYAVKEQSAGWHAIVDADGNAVTKNLRADAVAGFDAMSDDDKAKFIADNPKAE